jgi:hypothetical protein
MTSTILGSSTVRDGVVAAATPYPWPYQGQLNPARSALVALCDGAWRRDGARSDEADSRLVELATALRRWGALIVAVVATPVRRGLETPSGRWSISSAPVDGGSLFASDVTVEAGATSAFYASNLDDVLRRSGRTDLVLAGWGLEGPVHSTLRAANDRGFECLLIADASTPIEESLIHASTEMVRFSGGIFGAYASTNDVLAALGESAKE